MIYVESRWWQLKHFCIFTPAKLGEMIQFDKDIFLRGWELNHQLVSMFSFYVLHLDASNLPGYRWVPEVILGLQSHVLEAGMLGLWVHPGAPTSPQGLFPGSGCCRKLGSMVSKWVMTDLLINGIC